MRETEEALSHARKSAHKANIDNREVCVCVCVRVCVRVCACVFGGGVRYYKLEHMFYVLKLVQCIILNRVCTCVFTSVAI